MLAVRERVERRRGRLQQQRLGLRLAQVELADATAQLARESRTHGRETARQRFVAREQAPHVGLGAQRLRFAHETVELLGARDDARVESRELVDEREFAGAELVLVARVRQVQHADHATGVGERRGDRGLDVVAFAHDVEARAVGLAVQQDRALGGEGAAGDALARLHADLRDHLVLDADRDFDAQHALALVPEHQRAAVGAGGGDGDLEHEAQQAAAIVGEIVGVEALAQRLQQIRLAHRVRRSERVEHARERRRQHLDAVGARRVARAPAPGLPRRPRRDEPRDRERGIGVGGHARRESLRDRGRSRVQLGERAPRARRRSARTARRRGSTRAAAAARGPRARCRR